MKPIVYLPVATAAFLLSDPALADEARELAPKSGWNIDYAEDKCSLIREFSEGEHDLTLRIEQTLPEPFYNLMLIGQLAGKTRGTTMRITFGPSETPSERSFLKGEIAENDTPFILMHGIHLSSVPGNAKQGEFAVVEVGPEREVAISELTLERGLRSPITLRIGSMHEPLNAMRTCVADLVALLKLDESGLAQISKRPKPVNQQEVAEFMLERYPQKMLQEGKAGSVQVRLTVDKKGKPTHCQIATSDRPAVFDDYVCFGLLKTAEFEPARGPDGEARFGFWQTKVTYRPN
jgi:TonB family protein